MEDEFIAVSYTEKRKYEPNFLNPYRDVILRWKEQIN
jgi:hypothetical protein